LRFRKFDAFDGSESFISKGRPSEYALEGICAVCGLLAAEFSATWIIGGRAAVAQFGTPGGFSAQGGVDSQGEMVKSGRGVQRWQGRQGRHSHHGRCRVGLAYLFDRASTGGPLKTKLKLTASPDFKVGEFKPEKSATVHHYEDIYPGLPVEEHEGQVVWTAPIEFAEGVESGEN